MSIVNSLTARSGLTPLQRVLNSASLYIPLMGTLAASKGANPTFTRATVATMTDFEGNVVTVPSGCARFPGWRFVKNLLPSVNLTNASYTKSGGGTGVAPVVTYGFTDRLGGSTASRCIFNKGVGETTWSSNYSNVMFNNPLAASYTNRLTIRSNDGNTYILGIAQVADGLGVQRTITVTPSWQTFSVFGTATANGRFQFGLYGANGHSQTADVLVCEEQMENVTGKSNQNPSEYVSVGVASAPLYHGAGADGCKYFSYQNGNTVDANGVVTEAQGAALPTHSELGAELVTNGTFDTNISGVTASAGVNAVYGTESWGASGALLLSRDATIGAFTKMAYMTIPTVAGKTYKLKFTKAGGTAANIGCHIGTSDAGNNIGANIGLGAASATPVTYDFVATNSLTYLNFFCGYNTPSVTAIFDNVSVKEVYVNGMQGMLIEPARTNSARGSSDFTNAAYWTNTFMDVTANQALSPNNTLTADSFIENASSGQHFITSAILAGAQTFSLYAKLLSGSRFLQLRVFGLGTGICYASFNLSTGTVAASGGSAMSNPTITALPNGWYRCAVTYTGAGSPGMNVVITNVAASELPVYLGDGTSGFYIWGAQQELGVNATSYTETTTAAVTRNADLLTIPSSGVILGTSGSAYAEVTPLTTPDSAANVLSDFGTSNNEMLFGGGAGARIHDGVNVLTTAYVGSIVVSKKMASSWGGSTMSAAITGGDVVSGAFDGDIGIGTTLGVGINRAHSTYLIGTVKNIRTWPVQLPASTLQALTT